MRNQTVFYKTPIKIWDTATIVGPKESEGPIGKFFDKNVKDDLLGQKSYEEAEIMLHLSTLRFLLNKTHLGESDIDLSICGDLMDEIAGCGFAMRELDIPYLGLYNACATYAESLIVAAGLLESGSYNKIICSVSSHFSTAERQFRYPLELGSQRTPLAQWTVTGVGATLLNTKKGKVRIDCTTVGRVIDYGVTDANDMGAAMAPAARETLLAHFEGTGRNPEYYDLILTGDLGEAGSRLLKILMEEKGVKLGKNYSDCGILIYNRVAQDVGQGGSGTACSGATFNGYIYKKMMNGELKRVLLVPTGALLSKTSSLQGETIPGIAHAVSFTTEDA